jgi:hypothetical protein
MRNVRINLISFEESLRRYQENFERWRLAMLEQCERGQSAEDVPPVSEGPLPEAPPVTEKRPRRQPGRQLSEMAIWRNAWIATRLQAGCRPGTNESWANFLSDLLEAGKAYGVKNGDVGFSLRHIRRLVAKASP